MIYLVINSLAMTLVEDSVGVGFAEVINAFAENIYRGGVIKFPMVWGTSGMAVGLHTNEGEVEELPPAR